jgi:hypothetical protein
MVKDGNGLLEFFQNFIESSQGETPQDFFVNRDYWGLFTVSHTMGPL